MNIVVTGQEEQWIRQLAIHCKNKNILVIEESEAIGRNEIHLLVTDFPMSETRKGIFTKIPFLVVSEEKSENKVLEAFAAGAEGYIIKPVLAEVAAARIWRILWRYYEGKQELKKLHEDIHFTPSEYCILSHLMSVPGKVFTRNELIADALGEGFEGFDRGIDNFIKQIRSKIEDNPADPKHILTVYGIGYKYLP